MKMRVDNIPWWLKPFVELAAVTVAGTAFLTFWLIRKTCRVETNFAFGDVGSKRNYIFCAWHEAIVPLFTVLPAEFYQNHVWLNHPLVYMRPVHVLLKFLGVRRLILGSSGHRGTEAVAQLSALVSKGCSTFMFPDGPAGPPHELKSGVLHLSIATGVPVVPVHVACSRAMIFPTWDKKRLPLPFSKVTLTFGNPISVNAANLAEMQSSLAAKLSLSGAPGAEE